MVSLARLAGRDAGCVSSGRRRRARLAGANFLSTIALLLQYELTPYYMKRTDYALCHTESSA